MGCMLLLLEYYGLSVGAAGRGGHYDNGVAKGAGRVGGVEQACACNQSAACMCGTGGMRAHVCERACTAEEGGGRLSIMVCPLRGNYAES